MAHFALATVEANENGATNPTTGAVFDRFVRVRFATGQRAELHDDGIAGFIPIPGADAWQAIQVEPITTGLRAGERIDILLPTGVDEPAMGSALPPGWRHHMDLSGEDAVRLACQIVNPRWDVPALPFRRAYAPLLREAHILVASDIGRFVVRVRMDCGERHLSGADVQAGDDLWWTGYQRFMPLGFL